MTNTSSHNGYTGTQVRTRSTLCARTLYLLKTSGAGERPMYCITHMGRPKARVNNETSPNLTITGAMKVGVIRGGNLPEPKNSSGFSWAMSTIAGLVLDARKNTNQTKLGGNMQAKTNTTLPIEPLKTIDGKTLLLTDFPPLQFVVEELLPHGLFVLAGSPKIGKSWLSLMLGHSVSSGLAFWDWDVSFGSVLYLALEDQYPRLKSRYQKYAGAEGSGKMHFAVRSRNIKEGLAEQVDGFMEQNPDTKLIIIDTLQHVRGNPSSSNYYVNDYSDMNILREITNRHPIALVLVTHTRKMDDPDPLNCVSGSTGLIGAVDGTLILEKEARVGTKGKLLIANRDTEEHVFLINFNPALCQWELLSEEKTEWEIDPLHSYLVQLLTTEGSWCGTATELADKIQADGIIPSIPAAAVAKNLRSHEQMLLNRYGVSCAFKTSNNIKTIFLQRQLSA